MISSNNFITVTTNLKEKSVEAEIPQDKPSLRKSSNIICPGFDLPRNPAHLPKRLLFRLRSEYSLQTALLYVYVYICIRAVGRIPVPY